MKNTEKIKLTLKLLGRHIQKLREERGISISELATETGIRKEYLKKIENGNAYGVTLNTHLVKIANAIKVKLIDLFNYKS